MIIGKWELHKGTDGFVHAFYDNTGLCDQQEMFAVSPPHVGAFCPKCADALASLNPLPKSKDNLEADHK